MQQQSIQTAVMVKGDGEKWTVEPQLQIKNLAYASGVKRKVHRAALTFVS